MVRVLILVALILSLLPVYPFVVAGQVAVPFTTIYQEGTFQMPIAVRHAGDGTNRLFVVEKGGKIFTLQPNGVKTFRKTLFLDISDRVNASGSEQGLLGLAFHPNFKANRLFYVNYISRKNQTVVASYSTNSTGAASTGNRSSERVLLTFAQPYANHNGGDLAFGPDGYLYIATGDGGSAGDPQRNSQNLKNLLGKILRIDVRSTTVNGTTKPYRIPEDNPFAKRTDGTRKEIFAYGLRNPWRISFDRVTGELWTGDVGQVEREEVNIIKRGGNYGWNVMEGSQCYREGGNLPASRCASGQLLRPVFEYNRVAGKSVTGGYVYRGSKVKTLRDKYVLADFVSGNLWTLTKVASGTYSPATLTRKVPYVTSFGEDESGELYLVTYGGAMLRVGY